MLTMQKRSQSNYTPEVQARMDALLLIIQRHRGDWRAIIRACTDAGYTRTQYSYARHALIREGRVTPEDWPTRKSLSIPNNEWRLLRAMVMNGATPMHVARCFSLPKYDAAREIREAWALIELESK